MDLAASARRLTLAQNQPVLTADAASSTLYWTYGSLDNGALSLSLSGLAVNTVYDVFVSNNALTTTILPTRTYSKITNGSAIVTGTTPTPWTQVSSAFDGVTSKGAAACAIVNPSNSGYTGAPSIRNYLGQDWGVGVQNLVSKIMIYPPSIGGFSSGGAALEVQVDGSNNGTTWTALYYVWDALPAGASPGVVTLTSTSGLGAEISFRYYRVGFQGDGANAIRIAQIEFYTDTTSRGLNYRANYNGGDWVNSSGDVYLGSILTDAAASQVTCQLSYGTTRRWGVWNVNNQVPILIRAGIADPTYYWNPATQTSYVFGPVSGSNVINATIVCGLPMQTIQVNSIQLLNGDSRTGPNVTAYWSSIGVNSTSANSGTWGLFQMDTAGIVHAQQVEASYTLPPFFGVVSLAAIEGARSSNITCSGGEHVQVLSVAMNQ